MKIKVYDNPETTCRELWIGGDLYTAVNVSDVKDPELGPYECQLSLVIAFAPWEPGKVHMETT